MVEVVDLDKVFGASRVRDKRRAEAMAKKDEKKLDWSDLDETSLKGDALKAHGEMVDAQEVVRKKRAAFEEVVQNEARKKKLVPEGKFLKFAYNFGRIGVAQVDDDPRAAKGGKFKI